MPTIYMTPVAFVDMILAVHLNPFEVSGLGKIIPVGEDFHVSEVVLYKQKCSPFVTKMDEVVIGQYWTELIRAGKSAEIPMWRFWWHSHVYSRTEWSMVDDATFRDWRENSVAEWWVSVLLNKLGDIRTRVDYFHPSRPTFHLSNYKLSGGKPIVVTDKNIDLEALYRERESRMSQILAERVDNYTLLANPLAFLCRDEND